MLAGVSMFVCVNAVAQKKVDAYFEHLFNNKKFMGSVAISFNDSIIYAKSVGFADADAQTKINPDTKFRIASITKTYTAVLILKAVEEQKLRLDDKLSAYYPQVKNAEKITIEQLLRHRTGIFNFTDNPEELQWSEQFHTEQEFLDFFVNKPSNFEPGTEYAYSNTNYALLGFILQRLYQKSYAELLEEKICQPLQLKNTYYTFATDASKNEALSYNIQDKYVKNAYVNFSNHPASGGIASTAVELNKFLSALFDGKIISPESLKMMLPEKNGEYGLGIERLWFKNPQGYVHTGRLENYISEYWYFPKERLGIVMLSNAVNIGTDSIMTNLLQYVFGKAPELTDFNKTDTTPEAELSTIKGTYFDKEGNISVTISSDGNNLIFQDSRSGQDYIPLERKGKNVFVYEDIKVQFFPKKGEMLQQQGTAKVTYKKHKA